MNIFVLIFGGLPWLSPLLIAWGFTDLGELLFRFYTPLCHQSPQNSPTFLGHQVAFCNREAAMYGSLFIGGLIFSLPPVREFLARRPLPIWAMLLLLVPLVVDGFTQTMDAAAPAWNVRDPNDAPWSFNWWMRIGSGTLFGLAVVMGVYPRLDRDLRGTGETYYERFEQHDTGTDIARAAPDNPKTE